MSEFLDRIVDDAFAWSTPPLESIAGSPVPLGEAHIDDLSPYLYNEPELGEESVADERLSHFAGGGTWDEARPKAQPPLELLNANVVERVSETNSTQTEFDESLDGSAPPHLREPVVQDRNNVQGVEPLRSEACVVAGGRASEGSAQSSGAAQREEKGQTSVPGDAFTGASEELLRKSEGFPAQAPQLPVPPRSSDQVADPAAPPAPLGEAAPLEARPVVSPGPDVVVARHRPPQDAAEVDVGVELISRRSPKLVTPVNGNLPPAIRLTEVIPKPNDSRLPTEEVRRIPERPGLLSPPMAVIPRSNIVGPPIPVRQVREVAAAAREVAGFGESRNLPAHDGTAAKSRLIATDAVTRSFDADSGSEKRAQSRQVDVERKERPLRRTDQEGRARPSVYIGQVEIIVEVPSEPAHAATPSRSAESAFDLGSNFMRRL